MIYVKKSKRSVKNEHFMRGNLKKKCNFAYCYKKYAKLP